MRSRENNSKGNSKNLVFIAVGALILIIVIIGIVYYFRHRKPTVVVHTIRTTTDFSYSAWLPDWAGQPALDSFNKNKSLFLEASPVWYGVKEDGTIVDSSPKEASAITTTARSNNVNLIPTVSLFDFQVLAKVLENDTNLQHHVDSIVNEVQTRDYDGIDLDYESTQLVDKTKYFEFLQKLSDKLHSNNKQLIVTVLPKWGDNIAYKSLKETRQVQDWSQIAKYADFIRIEAYNYTDSKSTYPGPIAPTSWVKSILDYAVTKAAASKFELGIPLYSFEWWIELTNGQKTTANTPNDPLKFVSDSNNNPPATQQERAYTNITIQKILSKYPGQSSSYQNEEIYRYQKVNDQTQKPEDRVVVYQNRSDVAAREQIAKDHGIHGVVYWYLGGEDGLLPGN